MAGTEITAQLVQELQSLNTFLRNQSRTGETSGAFGSQESSVQGRQEKADKTRQELASKSFETTAKELSRLYKGTQSLAGDLSSQLKFSNDLISKSISSVESLKELEKLPEQYKKALKKSSSKTDQATADAINSIDDIYRLQARSENLQAFKELKVQYARMSDKYLPEFEEKIIKLGYELKDTTKTSQVLDDEVARLAKTMGDAANNIKKKADINKAMKSAVGYIGGGLVALGKNFLTAAKAAMKYGTSVDLVDSKLLGMTNEVYSEFIAGNRQTIAAMGGSQEKFNEAIESNSNQMIWYTGDLANAARVTASVTKSYQMLGTQTGALTDFMSNQTKMFGKFNQGLSMTGEQFAEMNSVLTDDINVRSNIYRLNQKQRQGYFEDLQLTYESIRLKGLEHEGALRMVQTLNEMGGTKAKDRMKQAARLQAVMGAAGMAPQGARAAELLRGGLRSEGDKSEFAEIMKQANLALGEQMQGLGGELVFGQMVDGISQFLGPSSEFVKLSQSQARATDKTADELAKMNNTAGDIRKVLGNAVGDNLNTIVQHTDMLEATLLDHGVAFTAMVTSLKTIATVVGVGGAASLLGGAAKGAGGMAKGAGGMVKGAVGGLNPMGLLKMSGAGVVLGFAIDQFTKAVTTGESDIANALTNWAPNAMDKFGALLHGDIEGLFGEKSPEQKKADRDLRISDAKIQTQLLEQTQLANKLALEADKNRRREAVEAGSMSDAQIAALKKTGYINRDAY